KIEEVSRIEDIVSYELEHRSVDGVRAGTDHAIDNRRGAAVLGGIGILQDLELLYCIYGEIDPVTAFSLNPRFDTVDKKAVLLDAVAVTGELGPTAFSVAL